MFERLKNLNAAGVLGINRRNGEYTLKHNRRQYYPLADDKVATAAIAEKFNIPTPSIYTIISSTGELKNLHNTLALYPDFVIKPARGSGGDGIVVVTSNDNGEYRSSSGKLLEKETIAYHCSNILGGMYSLGGIDDKVIIQYRVDFSPFFEDITFQGVPDIRIIVFYGVPIMAMVRLPTKQSDGKANLHLGAIAAGINIATGRTTTGVWHNQVVTQHPDTEASLTGKEIPSWKELLEMASKCYDATQLGYMGVDIVLDKNLGPLLLEMNARPGLNIQIANQQGLQSRLEKTEGYLSQLTSVEKRLAFCMKHFD